MNLQFLPIKIELLKKFGSLQQAAAALGFRPESLCRIFRSKKKLSKKFIARLTAVLEKPLRQVWLRPKYPK